MISSFGGVVDIPRMIDQAFLDRISVQAKASPRKRKNFNFHADERDASHRLLNAMEVGSYIPPHRHADRAKDESIVVLRGRLGAVFFDEEGAVLEFGVLAPASAAVMINIPHGTWHTVVALAPDTVFFESKAGPYLPLTPEERAPWAPAEGQPGGQHYLESLERLFT
jgi:cupin fold WbuC family metalloprotein